MAGTRDALTLWKALFGETEGYLCVASGRRDGTPRLEGFDERYFRYPNKAEQAAEWIIQESQAGRETYFCVHLLNEPKRSGRNASLVGALWADADGATLTEGCGDTYGGHGMPIPAPSVVVESSPGRHQWYWLLTEPVEPKVAEAFNKRIVLATGADASGYDLTQLLRPPGTKNFKYEDTPTVRIVEQTGEVHDPDALDAALPELPPPPERPEYDGPEDAGFTLEEFLDAHPEAREAVIEESEYDSARVLYKVVCPWITDHSDPNDDTGSAVWQGLDGKLRFRCHHDHCAERRWKDYREYYNRKYDFIGAVFDGEKTIFDLRPLEEVEAEDDDSDDGDSGVGYADAEQSEGGVTPPTPRVTPTAVGVSRPEAASRTGGDATRDTVTPVTGGLLPSDPSAYGGGFPVGALPPPLRRFVLEAAHAKETPVEFVALPLLAALGTAIGASRRFRIERTWAEYPTLYAATVALPASGKSPAEDAAMGPVEKRKKAFNQEYRLAFEKYEEKYREWEDGANEARRKKKRVPPEPEKPAKKRIRIGDATLEAVQKRMVENPRGLVLARDELAGFFNSLNQYRAGSDREFWLSQHSGRVPPLDRKGGDESHDMDYPCVTILGSIQPEKLKVLDIGAGDGMVERFLFAWPEAEMRPDAERDISVEAEDGYHRVWDALYALEMGEDEYGNPAPRDVPLAAEAEAAWKAYRRAIKHSAYEPGTSAFMQGVLGKMKAHVPRLALILALVRRVLSEAPREEVREEDLDNAWELARYFVAQSHRVHTEFVGENKNTLLARALGRFLEGNGGDWTGTATELFDALKGLGYAAALPKSPDALTPAVFKVCRNAPALSAVKNKRTREGRSLTVKRAYPPEAPHAT